MRFLKIWLNLCGTVFMGISAWMIIADYELFEWAMVQLLGLAYLIWSEVA